MGYRSEVRALIYGSKENIDTLITTHGIVLGSGVFHTFKDNIRRYLIKVKIMDPGGDDLIDVTLHFLDLYGDAWKWHDGYEDVQSWTTLMTEAPDLELEYEFVRIGEESTDYEEVRSPGAHGYLSIGQPSIFYHLDEPEEEIPLM
jgi:hypothetical protein